MTDPISFSSHFSGGTILADKYEIQSLVGTGGCGSVYKARHLTTSKIVALKVLPRTPESDTTTLSRFMQESRTLASLDHPNIVGVLGLDLTDTLCLLAMEYVEGRTLKQYLSDEGPLSRERFVLIFSQVMSGLSYMHHKGVIHRDIKPDNLVITESEKDSGLRVRLVDFGLSKLLHQDQRITKAGALLGTPLYMSPEQCLGQDADCRSDIYAVGCVMFEAVTGSAPYQGDNVFDTAQSHISQPLPIIPARGLGTIPGIIHRATFKRPEERFQSASDVLLELDRDANFSPHASESQTVDVRALRPSLRLQVSSPKIKSGLVVKVATVSALAVAGFIAILTTQAEGVAHLGRVQEPVQVAVRKIEYIIEDKNARLPQEKILRLAEDFEQQEAPRGSLTSTSFKIYRDAHRVLAVAFDHNGDKVRRNEQYSKATNLSHSWKHSDAYMAIEWGCCVLKDHDPAGAKKILRNQIDFDRKLHYDSTCESEKVVGLLKEIEKDNGQGVLASLLKRD